MKCAVRIQQTGPGGVRPGKLDRRFYAFAARAAEESLSEPSTGALAKLPAQLAREFCHMRLNHRRPVALQLLTDRRNHRGMVMACVVNAIAREKVEDASAIVGKELASETSPVANVHLQQVQQSHPLRIDVFRVKFADRASDGASNHSGPLGDNQ